MSSPNKDDAVAGSSHEQPEGRPLPCYVEIPLTPKRSADLRGDAEKPWVPASTPKLTTPEFLTQKQGVDAGALKRSRRALNLGQKRALPWDSGSEGESEDEDRNVFDWDQESVSSEENDDDVRMPFDRRERQLYEQVEWKESARLDEKVEGEHMNEDNLVSVEENVVDERIENEREVRIGHPVSMDFSWSEDITSIPVSMDFSWSEDFTSFTGQKETYTRVPGPTFFSNIPTDIFCQIWDREFLETVAEETNEYAWHLISQLSDPDFGISIPTYLNTWTETTVEELYVYFAVLIYISHINRSNIHEYWNTGVLGMPKFRRIMSRDRYQLLSKFLHFVNNENLISSGYDRKISKVMPIIDHCNKKFADLYTPSQHLSLDESLLLWKGRLSWKQCIRSKSARFGVKSFELCEAKTGYLLQYRLYTGKDTAMHPGPLHGFINKTAKVVLLLMERYLDAGHVLVMDSWYNQLPLTRYLKSRRTDVLGTINRRQHDIPSAIKDLNRNELKRGESVARHSGDIALVAWQDLNLVTMISTYHQHEMVPVTRAGQVILKPVAVQDYNQYMGGVDLKDQKLSMFLMERTRHSKCYMKVFKRLFNTSILNAYIIYLRNPMHTIYSYRQFRLKVAEGLVSRYLRESSVPSSVPNEAKKFARLNPGKHFPIFTNAIERNQTKKRRQLRCVRCTAQKKRVLVTIMCKLCQVPLCLGKCWEDYHTLEKL